MTHRLTSWNSTIYYEVVDSHQLNNVSGKPTMIVTCPTGVENAVDYPKLGNPGHKLNMLYYCGLLSSKLQWPAPTVGSYTYNQKEIYDACVRTITGDGFRDFVEASVKYASYGGSPREQPCVQLTRDCEIKSEYFFVAAAW